MKKMYLLVISAFFGYTSQAQNLNPGDIVVIGYAADTGLGNTSYDEFTWLPLVDLEAGTKIYFTDAGYNTTDGSFMGEGLTDEILLRFIVPTEGITAGTVMTLTEVSLPDGYTFIPNTKFGNDFDGMLSIPNAGDQITVFQSDDDENIAATFGDTSFNAIFMLTGSSLSFTALNVEKTSITPVSNIDNLTNLTPGLAVGTNAVAVGSGSLEADETDNARYVGITSGTREEILAAVCQLSNWSRHDVAFGNDFEFGTVANGWTRNDASQFIITPLSVDETIKTKISIYPNPVVNYFKIKNTDEAVLQNISLYDNNGRKVMEFHSPQEIYSVNQLSSGLYFSVLTFENHTVVEKFFKAPR